MSKCRCRGWGYQRQEGCCLAWTTSGAMVQDTESHEKEVLGVSTELRRNLGSW